MKCGWGCDAQLTGGKIRAHFTICPKRGQPLSIGAAEGSSLKGKHGRSPGRKCSATGVAETGAASLVAVIARNHRWELRISQCELPQILG
jgi:hypothetical protein